MSSSSEDGTFLKVKTMKSLYSAQVRAVPSAQETSVYCRMVAKEAEDRGPLTRSETARDG